MNFYGPQPQPAPVSGRMLRLPPRNFAFTDREAVSDEADRGFATAGLWAWCRCRGWAGLARPSSLWSTPSSLTFDLAALGEHQAARDLDTDTLERRRRALGQDHPDTLTSASNLAIWTSRMRRC